MSDGDLLSWIRYLHAAAAVPKGDPDYAEAQAAVQHAVRKIRFLNRQANRDEITTPDALETARMSGLANTAGAVASAPVAPALDAMVPGLSMVGGPLEAFISRIAGNAALNARGVDVNAYERGMEAHPTATAVGEMVPPVLMALAARLGTRPGARYVSERLKTPLPEPPPPRPAGYMSNSAGVGPTVAGQSDPISRLLALLGRRTPPISATNTPPILSRPTMLPSGGGFLDEPTFLRRAASPPVETPMVNPASAEIARRLLLIRGY